MDNSNMPGAAVFLDFEKAFDSIEWNYLQKCLEILKFGPQLQQWVKIFYNDISSCVLITVLQANTLRYPEA